MSRITLTLCLFILAFAPTIQADEPPRTPAGVIALDPNPPLHVSLTSHQLRRLLEAHCAEPPAETPNQDLLEDVTEKLARDAFDDEERTAGRFTELLIEAKDRRLIAITPDEYLSFEEFVQWITDGAELTSQAPPVEEVE